MGDFAQLPVNTEHFSVWTRAGFNGRLCPTPCQHGELVIRTYFRFQWATLPNSLSTIVSLAVGGKNLFQWATLPNSLSTLLDGCSVMQLVSMGDFAQLPVNLLKMAKLIGWLVSMGDFAQLPVNFLSTYSKLIIVSMGDFAQLPVNMIVVLVTTVLLFQWATLPNSLSTQSIYPFQLQLQFQWATLPNSLSTLGCKDKPEGYRFNGRLCPTPCQLFINL